MSPNEKQPEGVQGMGRTVWWTLVVILGGTAILRVAYSAWQGYFQFGLREWLGLFFLVPSAGIAGATLSKWSAHVLPTKIALADFVAAAAGVGIGYIFLTADPSRPLGWLPRILFVVSMLAVTVRRRLQGPSFDDTLKPST